MVAVSVVLVVDDEPDLRYLLRRFVEMAGHQVVEAGNGVIALQAVAQALPDLVVTDIMMPVMDGAELIRRLRGAPATARIPILAVTASWQSGLDVDEVLVKPFDRHTLVAAVERLLKEGGGRQ